MSKITEAKVVTAPVDITRLLIANRGEIACRIIETAKKMGIETIAIYSEADRQAKHVKMADYAVLVGTPPVANSYLNIPRIIDAAKTLAADAIHPGYGFLSENASFAEACLSNDLIFIGPPATAMKAMSSKSDAKMIMERAHVPLIPGYHGEDNTVEMLSATANQIGYPVLLKAALGGGGKGMRVVESATEMPEAIASAKREARASFGDDLLLIEKYLVGPRHIEVQVFADQHNNTIYLSDRDCSIQRRHQKIVEEAPAPKLSETLRHTMGQAAVEAAKAIGYIGAGTVEFLLDASGQFYFMEMNTRLQVEHPITELITGQDLVEWQINVAKGIPLPLSQKQVTHHGHAIEVRIYAEDPGQDFLPSSGHIHYLREPPKQSKHTKVRVDSGILQGDTITSFYDPMLSKLIVWATTRSSAITTLSQALSNYRLIGPATNIDYLQQIISHSAFKTANINTHFIEQYQADLNDNLSPVFDINAVATNADAPQALTVPKLVLFAAISAIHLEGFFIHWRLNQSSCQEVSVSHSHGERYRLLFQFPFAQPPTLENQPNDAKQIILTRVEINGHSYDITPLVLHLISDRVIEGRHDYQIEINGRKNNFTQIECLGMKHVYYQTWHDCFLIGNDTEHLHTQQDEGNQAIAPLNGIVTALLCQPGDNVDKEQPLLIIEAMKMEYTVRAPYEGTIADVLFAIGDQVEHGEMLLRIDAARSTTNGGH